ncbi:MAG: hypothetical protein GY705_23860 [Bacteroidetes bacterium]|nr:hypothetical protein [Bacteroidota bacterium]
MFNTKNDQLYILIKSLTKAEKRSFKLYANRFQTGKDTKFIQLFDAIDSIPDYDEKSILKKLKGVEKKHLPNLKRHLYKQILTSLRLIKIKNNIDIEIREQLDFSRILYGKGMYMQSLKILDRIKKTAQDHHQDLLHLEILEFEKHIETRHITRSRQVKNKMESLLEESRQLHEITLSTSRLSNFNIQMQGWYITNGHARTNDQKEAVRNYLHRISPKEVDPMKLTFFENINFYQAFMWSRYILLDFDGCIEEAKKWVNLFEIHPQMAKEDPDLFMRGLYYLLTFYFLTKNKEEYSIYLKHFEKFVSIHHLRFNANSRMIAFVYLYLSKLNSALLHGQFEAGIALEPLISRQIESFKQHTDAHRILLFYYKLAYLYFGIGKFEKALDYLNEIIHLKGTILREDLHFHSRLLHLICHYELGHTRLVSYLLPSIRRSFSNSSEVSKSQIAALRFLKQLNNTPSNEIQKAFFNFNDELEILPKESIEKKAGIFFNIPIWIKSHLDKTTVEQVLRAEIEKSQAG